MKNSDQIKQWGVAEDDFLAPEIGVVERFIGDPFSSPEEDEASKPSRKSNRAAVCAVAKTSRWKMSGCGRRSRACGIIAIGFWLGSWGDEIQEEASRD